MSGEVKKLAYDLRFATRESHSDREYILLTGSIGVRILGRQPDPTGVSNLGAALIVYSYRTTGTAAGLTPYQRNTTGGGVMATVKGSKTAKKAWTTRRNSIRVSKDGDGKTMYLTLGVIPRAGGLSITCLDPQWPKAWGTTPEQLEKFGEWVKAMYHVQVG